MGGPQPGWGSVGGACIGIHGCWGGATCCHWFCWFQYRFGSSFTEATGLITTLPSSPPQGSFASSGKSPSLLELAWRVCFCFCRGSLVLFVAFSTRVFRLRNSGLHLSLGEEDRDRTTTTSGDFV